MRFLIYGVIDIALEPRDQGCKPLIKICRLLGLARYDQRSSGLVYQNAVDLVHNGVVELALDQIRGVNYHVVSQVVKPEFVVCSVGYVARMLCGALR